MELLDDKMRIWIESVKFVKPVPGVYVLYNRNKDALYIGETSNLERTFTKYVDTNFEEDECKQKTQFYQREFVENTKERQLQLIEEYKNESARLPSCNTEIELNAL